MDKSSKDKFTRKSVRDDRASKPFSETRRIIPSTEQSLQSITENLIRIYEKLGRLEKPEKNDVDVTTLEARLQILESKLDKVLDVKSNNIESKSNDDIIAKFEGRFDRIESSLNSVESSLDIVESSLSETNIENTKYQDDIMVTLNALIPTELVTKSSMEDTISLVEDTISFRIETMKNEIVRKCYAKFQLLSGELDELRRSHFSRIDFVKGELMEKIDQEFSLQSLNLGSVKEYLKIMNQNLTLQNQEYAEKHYYELDSKNEVLRSQMETNNEVLRSQLDDTKQIIDNIRDNITQEVTFRLGCMGDKIEVICQENTNISDSVFLLRGELETVSTNQMLGLGKTRDILQDIQNKTKQSLTEIITAQHISKNLAKNVKSFATSTSSRVESNTILKNIEELKEGITETNGIIKDMRDYENSSECTEENEVREDINCRFDAILEMQKSIHSQHEDLTNAIDKKFENISDSQKTIQEQQIIHTDEISTSSNKVLKSIQDNTKQTSIVSEKISAVNKNISRSNKEYADNLHSEMGTCHDNIIKTIFPSKSDESNSVYIASRKGGVKYLGREKQ